MGTLRHPSPPLPAGLSIHVLWSCQGLYQVRQSAEECRFFHGRDRVRVSLVDPSPASLENRIPPPSTLLATPAPPAYSSHDGSNLRPAPGGAGPDAPPPLPKELYRGRRRRRPRRRRSSLLPPLSGELTRARGGDGGGGGEDEVEKMKIDLHLCQEVVRAEMGRLETELGRQTARLARRNRR